MHILKSECCNSLIVNEYDANTRSYLENNICSNCKDVVKNLDQISVQDLLNSEFKNSKLNLDTIITKLINKRRRSHD
mgnify:CR=1 FL=1|tara:strand:+ start:26 stop:256 length:231 start_codon:yes stop_codon:yes gene_type:complete